MRILFTGASSFTGHWFAKELASAGHEVVAIFRSELENYTETRKQRVDLLDGSVERITGISFGDDRFLELIRSRKWDLLCHHASDVTNYKSPDFDAVVALANNTHNLQSVLKALIDGGCNKVILTGSVFESNEGAGSALHRAFSPYGLSKGLTYQTFAFYTDILGMSLGKFVIPNPFGPMEEFRFTSFLAKSWYGGETPTVGQPAYVRDNIHVSLLAKAYRDFAEKLPQEHGFLRFNPSGYADKQGAFTELFAEQLRQRLPIPCDFVLGNQTEFPEPKVRVNTDPLDHKALGWKESEAWDALAEYYEKTFSNRKSSQPL